MLAVLASALLGGAGCHHVGTHRGAQVVPLPPPGSVPTALSKQALPPYVVEPPDVLLIEVVIRPDEDTGGNPVLLSPQPISGQHLVKPDGTVSLGVYGDLPVAGMTLDQIRNAVRNFIAPRVDATAKTPTVLPDQLLVVVDVVAYNSKEYYVIFDGAGFGEQMVPLPIRGNETVLSALAQVGGLPSVASKRNVWVARRSPNGGPQQILPVDYVGVTQHGISRTNYQLLPGDRVYVKAEAIQTRNNRLSKLLAPIERVLGVTLLGSQTVNSISGRGNFNNSGF